MTVKVKSASIGGLYFSVTVHLQSPFKRRLLHLLIVVLLLTFEKNLSLIISLAAAWCLWVFGLNRGGLQRLDCMQHTYIPQIIT